MGSNQASRENLGTADEFSGSIECKEPVQVVRSTFMLDKLLEILLPAVDATLWAGLCSQHGNNTIGLLWAGQFQLLTRSV